MEHSNHQSASLVLVPTMQAVKWAACAGCGAPHPMAMKPPRDVDLCPVCGHWVAPPSDHRSERAALTGMSLDAILSNTLNAIGMWLFKMAKISKSGGDDPPPPTNNSQTLRATRAFKGKW